jgi:hypothetical protein
MTGSSSGGFSLIPPGTKIPGHVSYAVNDYWVEAGGLHCITYDGNRKVLPLEEIDLAMTVKLNRERGVEFVLRTKPTSY